MTPEALAAFAAATRGRRLAGIDLGTKTVGLAVSDAAWLVASPVDTIRRSKFTADAAALKAFCEGRAVGGLVLGLPLNMDGTAGPRAQATRAFARNLAPVLPLPLLYWDERLSTAAVTRAMIDADTSRAKRAVVVDQLAAAYILQGCLDALSALDI